MSTDKDKEETGKDHVLTLIEKSTKVPDPLQAMQLTQAALNAAHALNVLASIRRL